MQELHAQPALTHHVLNLPQNFIVVTTEGREVREEFNKKHCQVLVIFLIFKPANVKHIISINTSEKQIHFTYDKTFLSSFNPC